MKKTHIFIIVVIAVAIGILVTTMGDTSSYVSFDQAYQLASNGSGKQIHVVGELKKDASGQIIGITPGPDKVSFSFIMIDENKHEQLVHYKEPMPPDFTKSEKVVVVGNYRNDQFYADKIILKCPSKYQEEKAISQIGS